MLPATPPVVARGPPVVLPLVAELGLLVLPAVVLLVVAHGPPVVPLLVAVLGLLVAQALGLPAAVPVAHGPLVALLPAVVPAVLPPVVALGLLVGPPLLAVLLVVVRGPRVVLPPAASPLVVVLLRLELRLRAVARRPLGVARARPLLV